MMIPEAGATETRREPVLALPPPARTSPPESGAREFPGPTGKEDTSADGSAAESMARRKCAVRERYLFGEGGLL